jgi:protein transport protein SEC61 subunit gamma-like protein
VKYVKQKVMVISVDNEMQKGRIRSFLDNAIRVLRLSKKPKKDEFIFVAKVTGLGVLIVGFIGYIVETIRWLLVGG